MRRPAAVPLVVGIVAILLGALVWWASMAPISITFMTFAAPVALLGLGALGLFLSRH